MYYIVENEKVKDAFFYEESAKEEISIRTGIRFPIFGVKYRDEFDDTKTLQLAVGRSFYFLQIGEEFYTPKSGETPYVKIPQYGIYNAVLQTSGGKVYHSFKGTQQVFLTNIWYK